MPALAQPVGSAASATGVACQWVGPKQ